ncbi:enoyl-CoA hydratase/carnithine racemase [Pavlovales sp. CCMP2436]|nr:enoyl-CoA hydratase/carnithine racemase [Pavlovales sp. CCMP2436]
MVRGVGEVVLKPELAANSLHAGVRLSLKRIGQSKAKKQSASMLSVRLPAALARSGRLGATRRALSSVDAYETILYERRGAVGLITLNRPKVNALSSKLVNALNSKLVAEVAHCTAAADSDGEVGAIIITGNARFFAAGADITEMSTKSFADVYKNAMFSELDALSRVRKPIIAAVNGFALGGGCELAMACDFIIAGDSAVFGQPEIRLGKSTVFPLLTAALSASIVRTIPGLGGTQRFTRALGKARAMELVLTGDNLTAAEAAARGLVSRVVPATMLLDEAFETANKIAALSKPIVAIAKSAVNASFEGSLVEGLRLERHLFYSTFALNDQKVGMKAFIEKNKAEFTDT